MSDFLQRYIESSPRAKELYGRAKKRTAEVEAVYAERDALRAENERLREALQRLWNTLSDTEIPGEPGSPLEQARAALEGKG